MITDGFLSNRRVKVLAKIVPSSAPTGVAAKKNRLPWPCSSQK